MTGHPAPLVTWSKSFGQLPPGRVQSNKTVMKLFGVRKVDSDNYICTATNLLGTVVKRTVLVVVSLPKFTVKPPEKVTALIGETFTLNCTATGDPQPVVNWKKQGAQFPVGRSQEINGVLFIRNTKKEDAGNYICAARSAGFFTVETVTSVEVLLPKGKQGWCSGESARLPPMCPGFDSRTRRHMWAEFVGSLLCSERFFSGNSGFPLSSKTNI